MVDTVGMGESCIGDTLGESCIGDTVGESCLGDTVGEICMEDTVWVWRVVYGRHSGVGESCI